MNFQHMEIHGCIDTALNIGELIEKDPSVKEPYRANRTKDIEAEFLRCKTKYSFFRYQTLSLLPKQYVPIKTNTSKNNFRGMYIDSLYVKYAIGRKGKYVLWLCTCACGLELEVLSSSLRKTKKSGYLSCGCHRRKSYQQTTHSHEIRF